MPASAPISAMDTVVNPRLEARSAAACRILARRSGSRRRPGSRWRGERALAI